MTGPGTAFLVQEPDRHREEFQLPQGSGNRQQYLSEKSRTHRSAWTGLSDCPSDLAADGALDSAVCRGERLQASGLVAAADEEADLLHDDDKVFLGHVFTMGTVGQLAKPFKAPQLEYLKALGVPAEAFTVP
jgi:hypothetical protein